jgi:hypothetical protein
MKDSRFRQTMCWVCTSQPLNSMFECTLQYQAVCSSTCYVLMVI